MIDRTMKTTNFDISGKSALITGGGGFLGPEHACALASWGAEIVLVDIDQNGLQKAKEQIEREVPSSTVKSFVCDITDENSLKELMITLKEDDTIIDILVNNAALNPKMDDLSSSKKTGTIEEYDMRLWAEELNVGITGTFLCCKIFGSEMAKRGTGTIVNIASDLAVRAPDQRVYAPTGKLEDVTHFKPIGYSVVKTAMLGINRYLATYWADKGVRVNALVPGAVYNKQPDHLVKNVADSIPLGRWAAKDEYRDALLFLASDASSYMTGQLLIIDGGRGVW